jgi:membrane-anchored glycerophosphoryl diester phosphodiesterase (GDPDase)
MPLFDQYVMWELLFALLCLVESLFLSTVSLSAESGNRSLCKNNCADVSVTHIGVILISVTRIGIILISVHTHIGVILMSVCTHGTQNIHEVVELFKSLLCHVNPF